MLVSVNSLAVLYVSQGRYDEAGPRLPTTRGRARALGPKHPNTPASVDDLPCWRCDKSREE